MTVIYFFLHIVFFLLFSLLINIMNELQHPYAYNSMQKNTTKYMYFKKLYNLTHTLMIINNKSYIINVRFDHYKNFYLFSPIYFFGVIFYFFFAFTFLSYRLLS